MRASLITTVIFIVCACGARRQRAPDDDVCAHAQEPIALKAYVPAGTCATFACPLSDGTTLLTGACRK